MTRTNTILFAVAFGAAAVFGLTHPLHAQRVGHPSAPERPTRVPVTLALVDSLPGGAPFRILRRADVSPEDVILFRKGGDSTTLSEAVDQLILMRRMQGDTAQGSGAVRVRRPHTPQHTARVLPWAHRVMDDLHRAERREIAGVGRAQTVQIWLPPQRARKPQR